LSQTQQTDRPHLAKLASVALAASWRFLGDESGQDMIEYVLVAALLSLAAITASKGLGTSISSAYNSINSNLTSNT
jgi:pilus assembly protein Flp/PilA